MCVAQDRTGTLPNLLAQTQTINGHLQVALVLEFLLHATSHLRYSHPRTHDHFEQLFDWLKQTKQYKQQLEHPGCQVLYKKAHSILAERKPPTKELMTCFTKHKKFFNGTARLWVLNENIVKGLVGSCLDKNTQNTTSLMLNVCVSSIPIFHVAIFNESNQSATANPEKAA